ncbi:MAG: Lon-like protease helical domain-containing protein, partial [Azonexus sp.]
MPERNELSAEALNTACDPNSLGFSTTDGLADLDPALIHPRAVAAIHLGLEMPHKGYSLFVLGEPGSGRHAIVTRLLESERHKGPPPVDWCYVNNFANPARARMLQLPCGRGLQLRNDMQRFVGEIGAAIAAAFDSEQYRERVESLQEEEKHREEDALR